MNCNYCEKDLLSEVDGNDAVKIDSALRSDGVVGVRHDSCRAVTVVRGSSIHDAQPDEHQSQSLASRSK